MAEHLESIDEIVARIETVTKPKVITDEMLDAKANELVPTVIEIANRLQTDASFKLMADKYMTLVDAYKADEELENTREVFKEQTKPKTKAEITRAANKKRDQEKQRRKEYEEAMIQAEIAKAQKQKRKKSCKKTK